MAIKPPSIFMEEQSSKGLAFFKDIFCYLVLVFLVESESSLLLQADKFLCF